MLSDEKEMMVSLYITDISGCKSFLRNRFCKWLGEPWRRQVTETFDKNGDGQTWARKREIDIQDVESNLPFLIDEAQEDYADSLYQNIAELARFRVKTETKKYERLKYADGRYPCTVYVPTCPNCGHELDCEG